MEEYFLISGPGSRGFKYFLLLADTVIFPQEIVNLF
jgi:hypothetical protein